MADFDTLNEAFAELERRADAAAPGLAPPLPAAAHRSGRRALLVAATVVATLAVAGGAAYLARGTTADSHAGGRATTQSVATSTTAAPPTPSTAPTSFRIPQTAEELESRFRVVLGDTATFKVTESVDHPGAIVGTLTAAGATGGFDLQIIGDHPGDKAWCDEGSQCMVHSQPDGSSLAVARESLEGPADGVTYQVNLIRTDGVEFLMHLSNETDPKGDSALTAPQPPLTTDQMIAIVTSDRW